MLSYTAHKVTPCAKPIMIINRHMPIQTKPAAVSPCEFDHANRLDCYPHMYNLVQIAEQQKRATTKESISFKKSADKKFSKILALLTLSIFNNFKLDTIQGTWA